MNTVRCAVIGAGWWGTTAHVPTLHKHPKAELVAVQHSDRATAEKIARDYQVPHACTTLEEVLAIEGLDAVVISSIPVAHYAQAKAALQRGLHVLIEKPMTVTAAEAQELLELAKKKRVQFLISGPWHFTPHSIEARRLVRSGALGKLRMISILMTNITLGLYRGLPWERIFGDTPTAQNAAVPYVKPGLTSYSDPKLAAGGHIYCQASHSAAYVDFLTGRRPAEVFARFHNAGLAVDVYDAISLKLDDGTLVSLATNGAAMMSDRQYEVRIYGDKGMILQELWKGKLEFHDVNSNVTRYPDIPEADTYPMYEPARNLIDCVAGDAPNGSPASLGAFAMQVIDAAVRSAKSGKNIILNGNKRSSAKRKRAGRSVAKSSSAKGKRSTGGARKTRARRRG